MTRVILDFPGTASPAGSPAAGGGLPRPAGRPEARVLLRDPVEMVTAGRVRDVPAALARVEDAVRRGLTAAGFIGYEAAPAFDPAMRVRSGARLPLVWFGLFRSEEDGGREGVDGCVAPGEHHDPSSDPSTLSWALTLSEQDHAAAVDHIRQRIARGDAYQVNLTGRFRAPWTGEPLALYESLRRAQGSGYHALVETDDFAIASASPELFFDVRQGAITTRPMKGTRPRGRWVQEDQRMAEALRTSGKDRAENLMIVDLLRNDLGRVARPGSVQVPSLFDVERYRTVWQMTSTVTATLRDDCRLRDLLGALFPCGSVTGAPKISSMGIIADLETSAREVYCGAMGVVRPDDSCTFNVPIRTAWMDRRSGTAEYGAGGGVVWDSSAEDEYRELRQKAAVAVERWPRFALLETLRLDRRGLHRLDRHLGRLEHSAEYFGFPWEEGRVRARLLEVHDVLGASGSTPRPGHEPHDGPAHAPPDRVHRVRILLQPDGTVDVQTAPLEGPDGGFEPGRSTAAPMRVALAVAPVSAGDRFLYHKTTHRAVYEDALEAVRGLATAPRGVAIQDGGAGERAGGSASDALVADVVLWNQQGEATELTRGNLVVEVDGRLVTPPVSAGLLPGCYREVLLESGVIQERPIPLEVLEVATGLWSVNSLRGWIPLDLRAPSPDQRMPSSGAASSSIPSSRSRERSWSPKA